MLGDLAGMHSKLFLHGEQNTANFVSCLAQLFVDFATCEG